jgi:hypothetical protein
MKILNLYAAVLLAFVVPGLTHASVGGLQLDGSNDYVTFGQAPGLGAATFTIETWFKRTGAGTTTTTGSGGVSAAVPLVTKGRGEADGTNVDMNWFLGIHGANNVLVADFEEGATGSTPGLNHPVAGVTPIVNDQWYHAAVTYDGTKWQLFLNGVLERELVVGQPPRADSIQHAALGTALTSAGTPQGYFAGILDEVRIWNYARPAAQIAENLQRPIPSAAGLIGRWALDETSGTAAANSAGSGVQGTLVNGPVWTAGYPMVPIPAVTLISPADQRVEANASVTFSGEAQDGTGLTTATLYLGRAGVPAEFLAVETKPLSGTNTTFSFTTNLTDGQTYEWNVLVANLGGEQSWAPVNFRIAVDANYPDFPTLVAPNPGSTSAMPATLQVQVSDPNSDALTVSFYGRELAPTSNDFTLVMLPDTQKYTASASYAPILTEQTQWIVNNRASRNIVFVTQTGDLVDTYNNTTMWNYANTSFSVLDAQVPYGVLPGNHDLPTTSFNLYFPYTRYAAQPWYGGHYGANNDNSFQRFSAAGIDFVILHLQFNPPTAVIAWADAVLKANASCRAIVTTHGYLNVSGARTVDVMGSTEHLWTQLVQPNPNVHFFLCGHEAGEFARTDTVDGREVHQLLADYQARANGGDGWLRLLRFTPAEDKVYVETYSPHLGQFETDADSQFSLNFPMKGFRLLAQSENVPSGSSVSAQWNGLGYGSQCEWYVIATDATGRATKSTVWSFTTGASNALPPVISSLASVNITDSSASITWTTDKPADSQVQFGLDGNYGLMVADPSLITSHAIQLTGLTPGTTYHYQASSCDGSTNVAASTDRTLATLPLNHPPVADSQAIQTDEDTSVAIVLSGSDPDGNPLTYSVVTGPVNGTLSGTAPNLTYSPHANYHGPDSFTFQTHDGNRDSLVATVSITVTPVIRVPDAPPNLAATAGNQVVSLSWQPSSGATSYTVKRSPTTGGPYAVMATGLTTTTYSDTTVQNGTAYFYVVTANNEDGESAVSNEASATPQGAPTAPSSLVATAVSKNQINLTWMDNSGNESGFKIERSTDNVKFSQIATVGANVSTYSNTGLTANKRYYYRVRAYNDLVNSTYSNTTSATTPRK